MATGDVAKTQRLRFEGWINNRNRDDPAEFLAFTPPFAMRSKQRKQMVAAAEEKVAFCIERRVTGINISELALRELPESLAGATHLEDLIINSNQLESLPGWLRRFKQLKRLTAHGNRLDHLPDWIGELTSLTEISLSGNRLTHLPDSLSRLSKLERLRAWDNPFEEGIPEVITSLTSLRELQLGSRSFTSAPASLNRLTKLETLSLANSSLSGLPSVIRELPALKDLYLDSNQISDLPDWIQELHLDSLWLTFNQIAHVPVALTRITCGQIRLDGNPCDPAAIEAARGGPEALRQHLGRVKQSPNA